MSIPETIKKILNNNTTSNKSKIDTLLEIDSIQYTNLGKDSIEQEILLAKKNSCLIYLAIETLDPTLGKYLYKAQDINNA